MADWALPINTSNYATGVLQVIDGRLKDAVSLFHTDGSNIPDNSLKFDRTALKFQERVAGAWVDKLLSVAGGGTGAATAAGARANLGLGSLSIQEGNNVNITGGLITSLTSLGVIGTITATLFDGSGASLTNLNASNLASGTVPTARLGSGTANSSTFLRGDSTWAAPSGTLPSGLIAMFDTACPGGWTRFTPLDNRFPRGAAVYGATGGSDTHSHGAGSLAGPSHNHGAGSYSAASHDHANDTDVYDNNIDGDTLSAVRTMSSSSPAVTGTSAASGTGAVTGSTASASTLPSFLDVVFCKKD